MNYKEQYREFTDGNTHIPLFLQPWWLNLVFGKDMWNVVISTDKNKKIVGVLPYSIKGKLWYKLFLHPHLTPFLGPWIKPKSFNKPYQKYSYENKILNDLVKNLPIIHYTSFKCPPDLENWYPFYLDGFKQTTHYTYLISPDNDKDQLWNNLKNTLRTEISQAQNKFKIIEIKDPDILYGLIENTFRQQKLNPPFTSEYFKSIVNSSIKRKQGKISVAENNSGNIVAGQFIAWDKMSVYNLSLGSLNNESSKGATQLLIWESLCEAINNNKIFNFEGSMLHTIEPLFRHFGGIRTPYFILEKSNSKLIQLFKVFSNK